MEHDAHPLKINFPGENAILYLYITSPLVSAWNDIYFVAASIFKTKNQLLDKVVKLQMGYFFDYNFFFKFLFGTATNVTFEE